MRFFNFACAVSLLAFTAPLIARDTASPGLAVRETVLARAERELPGWRAKLPAQRPRLFFDAGSWATLRSRYASARGLERTYFDDALARARAIVAQPTPAYRTPEEQMAAVPGLSTFDAAQELWLRPVGDGMVALAFALALTDDPVVGAKLRDTVLTACRYESWGRAFNLPGGDLAAAHLARGIAVAYDWHPGLWNEADRAVILETIRQRVNVLSHAAYGGIFWAGGYTENHNQVDMAAVGLCGLAFLDELPEAAEWTALGLRNFEHVVQLSPADGSSEEGVPYWSYGTSFILQYIEGTRHVLGTASLYAAPSLRQSITMRLHASTPGFSATHPWGDAVLRDYYGPHHLLHRLAAEYRDEAGQYLASHLPFRTKGGPDCLVWTALWFDRTLLESRPPSLDHHAEIAGIVTTRSGWGENDYLLDFKNGFTNRNHSHLDAGALAFAFGGEWLLLAPGYGEGKGDVRFWDKSGSRWTFFSNATEAHTTLLVNGRNQRIDAGARSEVDTYLSSPDWAWAGASLTGAYADVTRVRRDLLHRRGDYVLVLDEVIAATDTTVEWLAQVPPSAQAEGNRIVTHGQAGSLELRSLLPERLTFSPRRPGSEHMDVPASRMKSYALLQKGTSVRFATLLLPGVGAEPVHIDSVAAGDTDGRAQLTLTGAGWRDEILIERGGDGSARVLATRLVHEQMVSLLSIRRHEVRVADLVLRFTTPVDLALVRTTEGAWQLDAATSFELAETLPDPWHLVADGNPSTDGPRPTPLPPGRYALRREGPPAAAPTDRSAITPPAQH